MLKWRIYYGDGSTWESLDGKPPIRDVQVIVQSHPDVGWHTMCKYDYYVWWNERWQGVDEIGLYDLLDELGLLKAVISTTYIVMVDGEWQNVSSPGFYAWLKELGTVLLGRTMTTRQFNNVMKRAVADLGKLKTGWLRDEERPNG